MPESLPLLSHTFLSALFINEGGFEFLGHTRLQGLTKS